MARKATSQMEDRPRAECGDHGRRVDRVADFDVADWAAELFALAQSTAYTKPNGTRVLDGDVLSDPYTRRLRCAPNGSSKPACDWHTDQRSSGGKTPADMLSLAP